MTNVSRECRHCNAPLPRPRPNNQVSCDRCRQSRAAARKADWYGRNKPLAIERAAAWKKRNPEKVQASTRARYERVKEHHSAVVEAWRLHNPERKRDHRENRRARERRAFVEDVDRALLWHLFDGLCGICLLPVGLDQMQVDIIPLVKGGLHRYSNVQPSHESCNKRKGASMPAERAVA